MKNTSEVKRDVQDSYGARPWLRSYPGGVPSDIDIPDLSISDAFDRTAEKWGNRTALVFYGKTISYRQLKMLMDRFAAALHHLGVRKGDRVALFLLNCPQFVIAYLGALKIGAVVTPITALSVTPELRQHLQDTGADTIVCQDILYDLVEKAEIPLKRIIVAGIGDYLPGVKKFLGKSMLNVLYQKMQIPRIRIAPAETTHSFEALIGKSGAEVPSVNINPREDVAILSYTAGTTDEAKGVMLTHYNLLATCGMTRAFWSGSFEDGKALEEGKETTLAVLTFSHIYGQVLVLLGSLLHGHTLVILTTPDLDDIVSAIGRYGVTFFPAVPGLYASLNDYEKTDRIEWKRMKLAISVADSLSPGIAKAWERRTGITIHEGYGLAEAGSAVCMNPSGKAKVDSLGIPLPGASVEVAHPEKAELVPSGEIGELVVKGPQLMKGYWETAGETDSFVEISGERWLRTGDLGRMDEEGYFHFYDRKRDCITHEGHSIFAREIEEVIKTHPMVKEAAVIAVPDQKTGMTIKAVIMVRSDARGKLSDEEVIRHCRERLDDYKVPGLIEFRGEIPRTDVGRVSRRELREERNLI